MILPARILRDHVNDLPQCRARRPSSSRELDQRDMILAAGQHLIARFGRAALTLSRFALGLGMSPATFRRHFCDLDDMLAEILRRHLRALSEAIGEVPWDHPDRRRAQRAAYIEATRCGIGGHTELHRMLLRDRHALPADLAEQIDKLHFGIGEAMAGDHADLALALLDTPYRSAAIIEPMLAAMLAAIATEDEAMRSAAARPEAPEAVEPARHAATAVPARPPREPAPNRSAPIPDWLLAYSRFEKARAGP